MPWSKYLNTFYSSQYEMELAEARARRAVRSSGRGVETTVERRGDIVVTTETRRDPFGRVVQTTVTEEIKPERVVLPARELTSREAEVVVGTTVAVAGIALLGALLGGSGD
jgi:hypothetical protein